MSAGLTPTSTAADLMTGYLRASPVGEAAFKANLKAITDHLTQTLHLPLSADDLSGIEYVYRSFYRFGPAINYTSSSSGRAGPSTYAALMRSTDMSTGTSHTYLASEENFGIVKTLESRNLIVPIVGDFAGPKALRAVGRFLKDRSASVTAFYVSNVEMYLQRNGTWPAFCANVAALPLDAASMFIRPSGGLTRAFGNMAAETAPCAVK